MTGYLALMIVLCREPVNRSCCDNHWKSDESGFLYFLPRNTKAEIYFLLLETAISYAFAGGGETNESDGNKSRRIQKPSQIQENSSRKTGRGYWRKRKRFPLYCWERNLKSSYDTSQRVCNVLELTVESVCIPVEESIDWKDWMISCAQKNY